MHVHVCLLHKTMHFYLSTNMKGLSDDDIEAASGAWCRRPVESNVDTAHYCLHLARNLTQKRSTVTRAELWPPPSHSQQKWRTKTVKQAIQYSDIYISTSSIGRYWWFLKYQCRHFYLQLKQASLLDNTYWYN